MVCGTDEQTAFSACRKRKHSDLNNPPAEASSSNHSERFVTFVNDGNPRKRTRRFGIQQNIELVTGKVKNFFRKASTNIHRFFTSFSSGDSADGFPTAEEAEMFVREGRYPVAGESGSRVSPSSTTIDRTIPVIDISESQNDAENVCVVGQDVSFVDENAMHDLMNSCQKQSSTTTGANSSLLSQRSLTKRRWERNNSEYSSVFCSPSPFRPYRRPTGSIERALSPPPVGISRSVIPYDDQQTDRPDEQQRFADLLGSIYDSSGGWIDRPTYSLGSATSTPRPHTRSYSLGRRSPRMDVFEAETNRRLFSFLPFDKTTGKPKSDETALEFDFAQPRAIKPEDSQQDTIDRPSAGQDVIDRTDSVELIYDSADAQLAEFDRRLIEGVETYTYLERKHGSTNVSARRRRAEDLEAEYRALEESRYQSVVPLDEDVRNRLRIQGILPVISIKEEIAIQDLSRSQLERVQQIWDGRSSDAVLSDKFKIQITVNHLKTLSGLNWLNDEVINFYMELIAERSQTESDFPSVHVFTTFFYSKLSASGFAAVKRWTRKINIFKHDLLIVPVHLQVHWTLAVIDLRSSTVTFYDSMGGRHDRVLQTLLSYLGEESQDKLKQPFDDSNFRLLHAADQGIPRQMNGSDCGVFACQFAEHISRDAKIAFSQRDMPHFRQLMVCQILEQRLDIGT